MRYADTTEALILAAARHARGFGHSYVGSIHLLMALAEEPGWLGNLLRQNGVEQSYLDMLVRGLYGQGTRDLPLPQGLTPKAKEILLGSAREAKLLGSRRITRGHILFSLCRRRQSEANVL